MGWVYGMRVGRFKFDSAPVVRREVICRLCFGATDVWGQVPAMSETILTCCAGVISEIGKEYLWMAPEYLRCYFSAGTLLADCSYSHFFPKEKLSGIDKD
jgi:hypothetical protein